MKHFYLHLDGGIYREVARSTYYRGDDATEIVTYAHVWPFEPKMYSRAESEFDEVMPDGTRRFQPIPAEAVKLIELRFDRELYQKLVMTNKASRKAQL